MKEKLIYCFTDHLKHYTTKTKLQLRWKIIIEYFVLFIEFVDIFYKSFPSSFEIDFEIVILLVNFFNFIVLQEEAFHFGRQSPHFGSLHFTYSEKLSSFTNVRVFVIDIVSIKINQSHIKCNQFILPEFKARFDYQRVKWLKY